MNLECNARWVAAFLLAAGLLVGGCPGPQGEPDDKPTGPQFDERKLRYELSRADDRLHVAATFLGAESGETTFLLPDRRGGQRKLYRGVENVQVQGEEIEVSEGDKPYMRTIRHAPNTVVKVQYDVVQTFESDYRKHRFRPVVQPSGAFFIGSTVLGHPKRMHVGLERPVVFDWGQLAEGERAVYSFGSATADAGPKTVETALGAVQNALFVVGSVEVAEASIRESTVRIASLGALPVSAKALSEPVVEIIRAQRKFWNDFDVPPYLVGLYGIDDCCWSVGDAVYRGFASLLAQREPRRLRTHVVQLIAHEHLHQWIPDRLGSPRPFRAYMWFNEGFTEYYARRFKVQTGVYDFETYVQNINETIEQYWNSPVRDADRTTVQEGFRKKSSLTRLPYQRGELLALNWNARIAEATGGKKSLDDVMLSLKEQHDSAEEFRISDETLASTVNDIASGVEISSEIERVIDRGERIDISKRALGPCATFQPGGEDEPPRFSYDSQKAQSTDCLDWFR